MFIRVLDSVIYYLWRIVYPSENVDEYKFYLTNIFGENFNLKTLTITNIFKLFGFKLGYHFKIVSAILKNKKNHTSYHFKQCSCSDFKYNTKLLFTNKSDIKNDVLTFIYVNKCVYLSKNEIHGRTLVKDLSNSMISKSLPSDKNLIFLYSSFETLFYILNRVDTKEYFNVEIFLDNYLITPISNYKLKCQTLHLGHDRIPSNLKIQKDKQNDVQSCMCNINEKKEIKTQCLGKHELRSNIQIQLQSLGIYQLYEHIFTFISRLKMVSYDIETYTSDLSESVRNLQMKNHNIFDSQNILENGTILNKLNILLIGSCTFMSVKSIKSILHKLTKLHINEDIIQSRIKKKTSISFPKTVV